MPYPLHAPRKPYLQDSDILAMDLPKDLVDLVQLFARRPRKGRNAHLIQADDPRVVRLVNLRMVAPRATPANGQWKLTVLGEQWLLRQNATPRAGLVRL